MQGVLERRHGGEAQTIAEHGKGHAGIASAVDGLGITQVNLCCAIEGLVVLEAGIRGIVATQTRTGGFLADEAETLTLTCEEVGCRALDAGIASVFIILYLDCVAFGFVVTVNLVGIQLEVGLRGSHLAVLVINGNGDVTRSRFAIGGVGGMGIEAVNLSGLRQYASEAAIGS